MDECCIPHFVKIGDHRITYNKNIILTAIGAKVYNGLFLNRIRTEDEKILMKNQIDFRRNRSTTSQILTIRQTMDVGCEKNLEAALLLVYFSKTFGSIHRGKMEQILLVYNLPPPTHTHKQKLSLL